MIRRASMLCAVVWLAAFAVTSLSSAQEGAAPAWISTTYVTVKPDMDREFQDILNNHWIPAAKKSDTPFVHTWRVARFGNPNMYAFIGPIENFATFDGEPPLLKVMKESDYAIMWQRLQSCVTEVRSVASRVHADVSFNKLEGAPPKMAVVSITRVKPGMQEQYAKVLKEEWLPSVMKLDYPALWSHQAVFGSPSNEWTHALAIENFAHLDKGPPLMRAMGGEGAAGVAAKLYPLIESDEMFLATFLAEFSFDK